MQARGSTAAGLMHKCLWDGTCGHAAAKSHRGGTDQINSCSGRYQQPTPQRGATLRPAIGYETAHKIEHELRDANNQQAAGDWSAHSWEQSWLLVGAGGAGAPGKGRLPACTGPARHGLLAGEGLADAVART